MAPANPTASLLEEGVLIFEDPEVGSRVDGFSQKGFPCHTEEGLDLCRKSTLDDQVNYADSFTDIVANIRSAFGTS